jgi:hypothetical protein
MSLNNTSRVDLGGYRHVSSGPPLPKLSDAVGASGTAMHLSMSPTGDLIVEVHVFVEVGGTATTVDINKIVGHCVTSPEVRQQVDKFDLSHAVPTNVRLLSTNFVDEMNKMISFTENPDRSIHPVKPLTCTVPYALRDGSVEMAGTPLWSIRCGCQRVVPIGQNTMTDECRQYCCLSPESMCVGAEGNGVTSRNTGIETIAIKQGTTAFAVVSYVIIKQQIPELSRNVSDHIKDGDLVMAPKTYDAIYNAFISKLNFVESRTYDLQKVQVQVDYCPDSTPSTRSKFEKESGYVTIEFTIESAIRHAESVEETGEED